MALLFASLLSSACAVKTSAANPAAVPASEFEQQLADSCGKRVIYPINSKCVALMGSVGPLLQHRSDLIMAIWRSCPQENPCYRIASRQPACAAEGAGAQPVNFIAGNDSCKKAQESDYSCAALLNDPVFSGSVHQTAPAQDGYECLRAKIALANFDGEVERTSVRIQWYRIFAAQGY